MSKDASFYLIFCKGRRSWTLRVRLATRSPSLRPGEVPVYVSVSLPDALFEKPTLRATITVDDVQVPPARITADVQANIVEQLRQALGVDVKLVVEVPER